MKTEDIPILILLLILVGLIISTLSYDAGKNSVVIPKPHFTHNCERGNYVMLPHNDRVMTEEEWQNNYKLTKQLNDGDMTECLLETIEKYNQ